MGIPAAEARGPTSEPPPVEGLQSADQGDVIVYRLPGPVDGGIGPRQEASLNFATGCSKLGHQTINAPSVTRTSTKISLDEGSRRSQ